MFADISIIVLLILHIFNSQTSSKNKKLLVNTLLKNKKYSSSEPLCIM